MVLSRTWAITNHIQCNYALKWNSKYTFNNCKVHDCVIYLTLHLRVHCTFAYADNISKLRWCWFTSEYRFQNDIIAERIQCDLLRQNPNEFADKLYIYETHITWVQTCVEPTIKWQYIREKNAIYKCNVLNLPKLKQVKGVFFRTSIVF